MSKSSRTIWPQCALPSSFQCLDCTIDSTIWSASNSTKPLACRKWSWTWLWMLRLRISRKASTLTCCMMRLFSRKPRPFSEDAADSSSRLLRQFQRMSLISWRSFHAHPWLKVTDKLNPLVLLSLHSSKILRADTPVHRLHLWNSSWLMFLTWTTTQQIRYTIYSYLKIGNSIWLAEK